jgi:hypothetical protein
MTPKALWLPFQVDDRAAVEQFYAVHLGLEAVDGWSRDGERGLVLRVADGARLEFVAPGTPGPAPLAFELDGVRQVDRAFADWQPAEPIVGPHRYPRGHYGFEVRDPAGTHVVVWSEK